MPHSQDADGVGLSSGWDIGHYLGSLALPKRGAMAWKPSVAIVGAGGMGALFGSILQNGGLAVTLIDTNAEQVIATIAIQANQGIDFRISYMSPH